MTWLKYKTSPLQKTLLNSKKTSQSLDEKYLKKKQIFDKG